MHFSKKAGKTDHGPKQGISSKTWRIARTDSFFTADYLHEGTNNF